MHGISVNYFNQIMRIFPLSRNSTLEKGILFWQNTKRLENFDQPKENSFVESGIHWIGKNSYFLIKNFWRKYSVLRQILFHDHLAPILFKSISNCFNHQIFFKIDYYLILCICYDYQSWLIGWWLLLDTCKC